MKGFWRNFWVTLPIVAMVCVVAIANDLLVGDPPRMHFDSVLDVLKVIFGSMLASVVVAAMIAGLVALIGSHMPADYDDHG